MTRGLLVKTKAGNYIQNPVVGAANRAMELMLRAAAELGMTPSARSRIQSDPAQADTNPFLAHGKRA
jgi:P27 family predicted phage terminase small subunit